MPQLITDGAIFKSWPEEYSGRRSKVVSLIFIFFENDSESIGRTRNRKSLNTWNPEPQNTKSERGGKKVYFLAERMKLKTEWLQDVCVCRGAHILCHVEYRKASNMGRSRSLKMLGRVGTGTVVVWKPVEEAVRQQTLSQFRRRPRIYSLEKLNQAGQAAGLGKRALS